MLQFSLKSSVVLVLSESLLEREQMWAGLDCVCVELFGWLWFAIG